MKVLNKIKLNGKDYSLATGVFVRYSAYADGTDFTDEWSIGQAYIGVATGVEAPTDKSEYKWICIVPDNSLSRIGEVNLTASGWVAVQDAESLYSQVVDLDGVTKNSQVDLTPSVEQLAVFYNKDLAFVTENEDGVVTVYAIGQKPQNDYTIQVTITEVNV